MTKDDTEILKKQLDAIDSALKGGSVLVRPGDRGWSETLSIARMIRDRVNVLQDENDRLRAHIDTLRGGEITPIDRALGRSSCGG